ncbi:MAG: hydroxymethylpyrimidine/phosphomethylpyrimidine kinase [Bacteroidales bacterium]|jgi:hydroxymethylpyrimidine/phosphomethylpyrimidine kinase|nr:hydroxymethylpyrimidine/phosphomethylpyrimidine kinase [Bacteroidales bacterium]MDI9575225.1 hydroxymethylpyrimidine/phosphomethylpyrimidine kinase [Bacteroidota bacterium]MDD3756469.1 hydroxymethylpyrimidine/phosphomethylpyrimidine kinase [Bacteroidales bacterium]MDY0400784.1 hydroxymethylpyrimidine/phosphomethylpyrimidine kinase [Bacteroidales bacterium]HHW59660.1 hydroxymethylpyrimidine/phosphomethylpyrimidine kinase [Bacteroidales bacterium]
MIYFLTIAASDNSGGAGIQQDIKIADRLNCWPLSAITGITVQNFNKIFTIEPVSPDLLKYQIENCINYFPINSIKIGAICSKENIMIIAECLKKFPHENIVIDPVIFSTSGAQFLDNESLTILKQELFPLAHLVTPNRHEFELLVGQSINSLDEAVKIAKNKCNEWNTAILLKGGHFEGDIIREALITHTSIYYFERVRDIFHYSHGTGCTLSSAIACYLGMGRTIYDSYLLASELLVDFYKNIQKDFNPLIS